MKTHTMHDPSSGITHHILSFDDLDEATMTTAIYQRAVELIATEIAKTFIAQHGAEILARISPDAIATLTMAEAGAAVNDTLKKKLPDKILEVVREGNPIVLRRGLFGGVTRVR